MEQEHCSPCEMRARARAKEIEALLAVKAQERTITAVYRNRILVRLGGAIVILLALALAFR